MHSARKYASLYRESQVIAAAIVTPYLTAASQIPAELPTKNV